MKTDGRGFSLKRIYRKSISANSQKKLLIPRVIFALLQRFFPKKKLEGVSKIAYRACVNFPSNCPAMSDLASMPPMPRSSAAPFRRCPLFAAAQGTLKAKVDVNLNAVCKLARFYSYHEGRTLGSVPCLMPGGRSTCCQELKESKGSKFGTGEKEGERADLSKHFFSCREVCKRQKKAKPQ